MNIVDGLIGILSFFWIMFGTHLNQWFMLPAFGIAVFFMWFEPVDYIGTKILNKRQNMQSKRQSSTKVTQS